ncbi:23S rRNA (adenine(2030)-N(6))-methyltransferase RlmJ [Aurantimonas sp. HBX-1]|uniref:23S rRNA (adenine(2030)-N(6))-methyltransferase RlmJ n=1 Tax=Aurantimonas sp. HBX-1 TaxID=2906072 RepID=UPI001F2E24DC|nr:23S rRNA (adenine(2030)-N(6))-methyltransferase RlmJ [Aurantimonas sp. HBX-1]UIJ70274.1 23S rRNA (adenine(2030)-N(6))-methyltransferase RlmJ [Aurantimonas sp. HBX-1]
MNYRHAYHAGNFADVVKHVLLTRLIEYLKRKDKPFRVFDTHAGRGLYDLAADEAQRTGESRDGVDRLAPAAAELAADPLFAAYLEAIAPDLAGHRYPGSPLIARRLLRRQDRLSAYELHPADAAALRALFAGDVQVKAIELDAWLALGSHLPPKEKRGLVLIDPPFEKSSEIEDIAAGLARAYRRWPGGIYAVWYPLKRQAAVAALHRALAGLGAGEIVVAEFLREPYGPDERFVGTGLAVVNPPYVFAAEAEAILTRLVPLLGHGPTATARVFALPADKP